MSEASAKYDAIPTLQGRTSVQTFSITVSIRLYLECLTKLKKEVKVTTVINMTTSSTTELSVYIHKKY